MEIGAPLQQITDVDKALGLDQIGDIEFPAMDNLSGGGMGMDE